MSRSAILVGVVVGVLGLHNAVVSACGDKFLRVGRSMRFRGYNPVHHASILIYVPSKASSGAVRDFQGLLSRVGHTSTAVRDAKRFSEVLESGKYEIVIAQVQDVAKLADDIHTAPSRPEILQVVDKTPTPHQQHVCVLHPASTGYEALVEIDHLMDARLKRERANAPNVR